MVLKNESAISSEVDDEVVIKVEQVSKKFSKSLKRSMLYGMKDIVRNVFRMSSKSERLRKGEFWAVNGVSFEVRKGECLGIIGPNGAGKTTMLSILNGIYMPDQGKITIKGKTGALIAVGAGFHPMLTGRENVYIKGAVLGMSKEEINEKFDAIVEFADIGDFLDMPVKNYSSGMFVRLGFAVAIHCEPDILLVDEILSVGDIRFRDKSQTKFMELLNNGTTVVFVSHSLEAVRRICDKVLFLDEGKIVDFGETETVISNYSAFMNRKELKSLIKMEKKHVLLPKPTTLGTGRIEILNCKAYEEGGNPEYNEIEFGKNIVIEFEYECYEVIENPEFVVSVYSAFDKKRIAILQSSAKCRIGRFDLSALPRGTGKIRFTIKNNNLHHGVYFIEIGVSRTRDFSHQFIFRNCQQFLIKGRDPQEYYSIYGSKLTLDFDFTVERIDE